MGETPDPLQRPGTLGEAVEGRSMEQTNKSLSRSWAVFRAYLKTSSRGCALETGKPSPEEAQHPQHAYVNRELTGSVHAGLRTGVAPGKRYLVVEKQERQGELLFTLDLLGFFFFFNFAPCA